MATFHSFAESGQVKKYHFEYLWVKKIYGADIEGNTCHDLKGVIYEAPRVARKNPFFGEKFLKVFQKDIESDRKQREEWLSNPPDADSKFFCFPFVSNIQSYLEKGSVESIDEGTVDLSEGPVLIRYKTGLDANTDTSTSSPSSIKSVSGRYLSIKKLYPCASTALASRNEQCADVEYFSNVKGTMKSMGVMEYRVFCWDCSGLNSILKLQQRILFKVEGFYKGYALSGGYMAPNRHFQKMAGDSLEASQLKSDNLNKIRNAVALGN